MSECVVNWRWWPLLEVEMTWRASACIHDSNEIPTVLPMFSRSGYTTRLQQRLPDEWICEESKMTVCNRKRYDITGLLHWGCTGANVLQRWSTKNNINNVGALINSRIIKSLIINYDYRSSYHNYKTGMYAASCYHIWNVGFPHFKLQRDPGLPAVLTRTRVHVSDVTMHTFTNL